MAYPYKRPEDELKPEQPKGTGISTSPPYLPRSWYAGYTTGRAGGDVAVASGATQGERESTFSKYLNQGSLTGLEAPKGPVMGPMSGEELTAKNIADAGARGAAVAQPAAQPAQAAPLDNVAMTTQRYQQALANLERKRASESPRLRFVESQGNAVSPQERARVSEIRAKEEAVVAEAKAAMDSAQQQKAMEDALARAGVVAPGALGLEGKDASKYVSKAVLQNMSQASKEKMQGLSIASKERIAEATNAAKEAVAGMKVDFDKSKLEAWIAENALDREFRGSEAEKDREARRDQFADANGIKRDALKQADEHFQKSLEVSKAPTVQTKENQYTGTETTTTQKMVPSGEDKNSNGIPDIAAEDEEAYKTAKSIKESNPIESKALMEMLKEKYPNIL